MKTKIVYYGMIAEKLKMDAQEIVIPMNENGTNLRAFFLKTFPELNGMSFSIAVNQEIVETIESNTSISEIALLPPFAGG